ncbi:MAG: NAD(P)-dependent oxidoreductase, partial [Bdellovibrionales bacterium]|nr:NAD(P)-dependent oxidoreductase [Bdellovibrionales bacterium]
GCRFIHISTDYVFQGTSSEPYTEEDETSPINVYGASKLAGEKGILEVLGDKATIVRTSSLHGKYGANFVHTMLELFSAREKVSVVSDQIMSPTWAGWLAGVLLDLCRIEEGGIFHACSEGALSWFEFAKAIADFADDDFDVEIEPVPASTFPRPAPRPAYSVMSCEKLSKVLGRKPLSWDDGLKRHLRDIGRIKGA